MPHGSAKLGGIANGPTLGTALKTRLLALDLRQQRSLQDRLHASSKLKESRVLRKTANPLVSLAAEGEESLL